MSFRKPYTILTEAPGMYVLGEWIPGTRSNYSIQASVQPVGRDKDMLNLPEGRHFSDVCKMYTDGRLKVTADGEGVQPDIVVYQGYGYELNSMDQNQSDVINHYKYWGTKVFKFTSLADWNNGILKRP